MHAMHIQYINILGGAELAKMPDVELFRFG